MFASGCCTEQPQARGSAEEGWWWSGFGVEGGREGRASDVVVEGPLDGNC